MATVYGMEREKEIKPKLRGWKEGILTEDLRSVGGTVHRKGSIVRYKKHKCITEYDKLLGDYEYHYLDQTNYNLVGSHKLLIQEENENKS